MRPLRDAVDSPLTEAVASPFASARRRGSAPTLPEVGLRGIGIHAVSLDECVAHVLGELDQGRGGWVVLATLELLRRAKRDEAYREMIDEADVRIPDGKTLVWACRLQRTPVPERVGGQDLLVALCHAAGQQGRRVFLLGGRPGSLERTAEAMREDCADIRIVGAECPDPGFESDPLAMAKLSRTIVAARPDLVFVALESPVQERVVRYLRHDRPEAWWIGVGDRLYYVSGELRSAPGWMGDVGLEWAHQLVQEPRRLFDRFVLHGLPAGVGLLARSALRGTLPVGKREGTYGVRNPSALLVDDDPHALDQLEILLSSRFPDLEIEARTEPDVSGRHDFYFLDNDFGGDRLAARLAAQVHEREPRATIIAFSGVLDVGTLKRLINAGCDGVCDKAEPRSWRPILELMERRLAAMRSEHAAHSFGGVRNAAWSIRELLADWNRRAENRAGRRTAEPAEHEAHEGAEA